ncbi:FAD-dependent oxidoreductase [Rapidithrix thailandica]|uniref:FAD-dependent oxidoreductase n=1 Tax=Rapidithrix thailandica TaxID=413964 RepID=A0AAW9RUM5_9BACT
MLSYWEKDVFLQYDYILVGAGIVGLSTAIALAENQPDKSILVLERGLLPTGASTKNAGFACFGSVTEILSDLQQQPAEEVQGLIQKRWEGLQKLRTKVGDQALGYQAWGGYELILQGQAFNPDALEQVNEWLWPLFKRAVFTLDDSRITSFGFSKQQVKHIIHNPLEGQLHPGRLMHALLKQAQTQGVKVLTGAEVRQWKESKDGVELYVFDKTNEEEIIFQTDKLALCTNAFSKQLLPGLDLTPGRGMVLVTSPVPKLKIQGTFHFEEGYYYFRNIENRVLLGGGRHLALAEESTTEMKVNPLIRQKLNKLLTEVLLPNTPFSIEHEWAGVMAFGKTKQPVLCQHSARVFLGLRLGGMGVAIGMELGERLAELLDNS